MRTLPQRLLDRFLELGDRVADHTIDPSGCCCSPSSSKGSVNTSRKLLLGAPEDMFATHITRLTKQLDEFLTPVPDVIVQEYDVQDYQDDDVRDEKELTEIAALLDATASTIPSDERQATEASKEDDPVPPLLEVVSMESSVDNDGVSLLCDSSASSSSSADGDMAVPTQSAIDTEPVDPVIETASTDYVEAELCQAETKEYPDDEIDNSPGHSLEQSPTDLAESFIDCRPVQQIICDNETANDSNSPIDTTKIAQHRVGDDLEGESTTQLSTEHDEPVEETTLYSLEDLKRHKILGEGQFGQVWMVSPTAESSKTKPKPYALKVLTKLTLIAEDLVDAIIQERDIMAQIKGHPFIVELHSSFQNDKFICLLEEFCQGGELFSLMHDKGRLPVGQAKFYSCCIADALSFLHSRNIVFRDLKPENVMLDNAGYPKLIDFGYAKQVVAGEKTYSFCGTPRYFSPEMIAGVGHGYGVDHWSLGILIYEQLTAENPFCYEGMDERSLFETIQQEDYSVAKIDDPDAVSLIHGLLIKDPRKRLGAEGSSDVQTHSWFEGVDLAKLRMKQVVAPWQPKVKDDFDCCCFDDWEGLVENKLDIDHPKLTKAEENRFKSF